jgi:hypothetical protein
MPGFDPEILLSHQGKGYRVVHLSRYGQDKGSLPSTARLLD